MVARATLWVDLSERRNAATDRPITHMRLVEPRGRVYWYEQRQVLSRDRSLLRIPRSTHRAQPSVHRVRSSPVNVRCFDAPPIRFYPRDEPYRHPPR